MDKTSLLKKLLQKKETKDYTYAILFFVLSSIFAFFAIKPALSIAFSLNRQAQDLQRVNNIYEGNLGKLVDIQTQVEAIRDKTDLLERSIPAMPQTTILIDDIKQTASQEGILLKNFNLSSFDLKNSNSSKNLETLTISMETTADFNSLQNFLQDILSQKRLKAVKHIKILTAEDKVSSSSGILKISLEMEGFYY